MRERWRVDVRDDGMRGERGCEGKGDTTGEGRVGRNGGRQKQTSEDLP